MLQVSDKGRDPDWNDVIHHKTASLTLRGWLLTCLGQLISRRRATIHRIGHVYLLNGLPPFDHI